MTGKSSISQRCRFFIVFSMIVFFSFVAATLAFTSQVSPETHILSRISLTSLDATGANGSFRIEVKRGGKYVNAGEIPFNSHYRTGTLSLGTPEQESPVYIRITKQGGGAGHIDAIQLGTAKPFNASASIRKLSSTDYDVVDATEHPVEVCFDPVHGKEWHRRLALTARIESEQISTVPFHYPRENLYKEMTEDSMFYTYRLGSHQGSINVDGVLDEQALKDPFFTEYIRVGSGHPQGETLSWVMDDGENLFVSMDFTADNTIDGTADYAKVYARTPEGVKEFKVSSAEHDWGRAGFTYTEAVSYQHKTYEFCIPLEELGIKPAATGALNEEHKDVKLAFAAYGTAAPGETYISLAYDPNHHQYLAAFIYANGMDMHVYGQLLDGNGEAIGSSFQISSYNNVYDHTDVAFDPVSNRYLVVWYDDRNFISSGLDIFGQLISADGSLYHNPGTPATNLTICNEATNQYYPTVAADTQNGRFFVVWHDRRDYATKGNDIYGQFVNRDGTLYPTPGDSDTNMPVCTYDDFQDWPDVSYDSSIDRFLVAWSDYRNSGYDIYGQIVNGDGSLYPSGIEASFEICSESSNQGTPSVGNDSVNSRFIVCWNDSRNGIEDIYGQILNSDGSLYYPSVDAETNIQICTASNAQYESRVSFDPEAERFCVTWEDYRNTNNDIYMQLVDAEGALYPNTDPAINEAIAATSNREQYSDVSLNPFCNNFFIAYGEEYDPGTGTEFFLTVASSTDCSPYRGMLAFTVDTNSGVSPESGSAGDTLTFSVEYWGNSIPQKAELILEKGSESAGFTGSSFRNIFGKGTPILASLFIAGALLVIGGSGLGLYAAVRRKRPACVLIPVLVILLLTGGGLVTTCGSNGGNAYTMQEVDPSDSDCLDGKEYQIDVTLSESGTYNYRFSFKDWSGTDCFGVPTQQMTITVN